MARHPAQEYFENVANDPSLESSDFLEAIRKSIPAFWKQIETRIRGKKNLDVTKEGILHEGKILVSWNEFTKKELEANAKILRKQFGPFNSYQ